MIFGYPFTLIHTSRRDKLIDARYATIELHDSTTDFTNKMFVTTLLNSAFGLVDLFQR